MEILMGYVYNVSPHPGESGDLTFTFKFPTPRAEPANKSRVYQPHEDLPPHEDLI